jgi:hypothetical protein
MAARTAAHRAATARGALWRAQRQKMQRERQCGRTIAMVEGELGRAEEEWNQEPELQGVAVTIGALDGSGVCPPRGRCFLCERAVWRDIWRSSALLHRFPLQSGVVSRVIVDITTRKFRRRTRRRGK